MRFVISRTSQHSYSHPNDGSPCQDKDCFLCVPPCEGLQRHEFTYASGSLGVVWTKELPTIADLLHFVDFLAVEVVLGSSYPLADSAPDDLKALPQLEIYDDYREWL